MQEIVELRSRHTKHFDTGEKNPNGAKVIQAVITKHSQHYLDDQNKWRDIETEFEYEEGFGHKVKKANHHLRLLDNRIRFGFEKGLYATYKPPTDGMFEAQVEGDKISFLGAYTNTDVIYTATNDGLKQEIVLHGMGHPNSFDFILEEAVGVTPALVNNSIEFRNQSGDVVGVITAPYMLDALGNMGDVTLSLNDGVITTTPNADWLSTATYPVVIDPTTILQPDEAGSMDTLITSRYPTANYVNDVSLVCGKATPLLTTYKYHSLLKFDVSFIPPSAAPSVVATLTLYQEQANGNFNMNLYKILASWNESTVTWNTAPLVSSTISSLASIVGSDPAGTARHFDMTLLVRDWVSGAAFNHGVCIKNDEALSNQYVYFRSSYHSNPETRPRLYIVYSLPAITKTISETITLTDFPSRFRELTRQTLEYLDINETFSRPRILYRMLSMGMSIQEGIAKPRKLMRSLIESISTFDSKSRSLRMMRIVAEALSVAEVIKRSRKLFRIQSTSVGIIEVTARLRDLKRVLAQNVALYEALSRSRLLRRITAENIAIAENKGRYRKLIRILSKSLGVIESIVRSRKMIRVLRDGITLSEVASRLRTLKVSISEILSITESRSRFQGKVRVLSAALGISEAVSKGRKLFRSARESLSISELPRRFRSLKRIILATMAVTDNWLLTRILKRFKTENVVLSDKGRRLKGILRILSESIGVLESAAKILSQIRNLIRIKTEALDISENAWKARLLIRIKTNTIRVAERWWKGILELSGTVRYVFKVTERTKEMVAATKTRVLVATAKSKAFAVATRVKTFISRKER